MKHVGSNLQCKKFPPVFVDEGVEGHPVSPAGGEVVDVDVWISGQEEEVTAGQVLVC